METKRNYNRYFTSSLCPDFKKNTNLFADLYLFFFSVMSLITTFVPKFFDFVSLLGRDLLFVKIVHYIIEGDPIIIKTSVYPFYFLILNLVIIILEKPLKLLTN